MIAPRPGGPLLRVEGQRLRHSDRHMIRNCRDIYLASDVARYFGLTNGTVARIYRWEPDCDCHSTVVPNIWETRPTYDLIIADAQILANRGYSLEEIAAYFGVKAETVQKAHKVKGLTLRLHSWHTDAGVRNFEGALEPGREVAW